MFNAAILRVLNNNFINRVSINLLANIAQAILAITLLPIATLKLGPDDYGVYGAIVLAIAFIATLCDLGSSYIIYGHHETLTDDERKNMFFTLCFFSTTLSFFFIIILYFILPFILPYLSVFSDLSSLEVCLIFLAIALRAIFGIMTPALIISNKSVFLAKSIFIQSLVNFIVVLLSLFCFESGRSSLILGNTFGLIASVIFSLKALNLIGIKKIQLKWFNEIKKIGIYSIISNLFESARLFLENIIISNHFGNWSLGIYTHARSYQAILFQTTNAVSSVSWPISLDEARRGDNKFLKTSRIWEVVYLLLIYAGIFFVFWGENFIVFLTNEKFKDASTLLPWLVVYVLVQNSSKPATAILFIEKKGIIYSNVRTIILALTMLLLIFVVPMYGLKSVVIIAIGEILISRIIFTIIANRLVKTPYKSLLAIIGCLLILFIDWLNSLTLISLNVQIFSFVLLTITLIFILYYKLKIVN